jgi:hypothetical protein
MRKRATSIQNAGQLDSIIARLQRSEEFCNTIDPEADIHRPPRIILDLPPSQSTCAGSSEALARLGMPRRPSGDLPRAATDPVALALDRDRQRREVEEALLPLRCEVSELRRQISMLLLLNGSKTTDVVIDPHLPTRGTMGKAARQTRTRSQARVRRL